MIIAANIKTRPNNFPFGFLSTIEPPSQLPKHKLVIIMPIKAVHTIRDVPKNGATIREPANSKIIVAAPLKNETNCNLIGILAFLPLFLLS